MYLYLSVFKIPVVLLILLAILYDPASLNGYLV